MPAAAPQIAWNTFASSADLAVALSGMVAERLRSAIDRRGKALIAVSGGTTPALFFRTLANEDLDWSKVTVTLVDERFVSMSSPRSNAALVAENLLQNRAAAARFAGLYRAAGAVEEAARQADEELQTLHWPLDVAVLGMGLDGHTASFFPDAVELPALLDPVTSKTVMAVNAPSAGEPRLTLPLATLVNAGAIALHIEGSAKRGALEAALQPGNRMPVRSVLDNARTPVQVFWAP